MYQLVIFYHILAFLSLKYVTSTCTIHYTQFAVTSTYELLADDDTLVSKHVAVVRNKCKQIIMQYKTTIFTIFNLMLEFDIFQSLTSSQYFERRGFFLRKTVIKFNFLCGMFRCIGVTSPAGGRVWSVQRSGDAKV